MEHRITDIPYFPRKREPSVLASRLVAGTKPLGSRFRGNDGTTAMLPKLQLQLQLQPPFPVPTTQSSPSSSASPPPASTSPPTPPAPSYRQDADSGKTVAVGIVTGGLRIM